MTAREVLAERIASWPPTPSLAPVVYADRLIADLERAGYRIEAPSPTVTLGDPDRFVLPDCAWCGEPAAGFDGSRGYCEPLPMPEGTVCGKCCWLGGIYDEGPDAA